MTVESCVKIEQTCNGVLGARRKQSLYFDLLQYYPLLIVCLQYLSILPTAALSFQMVCEGKNATKQCYVEYFNSSRSSLSELRSKLPTGVVFARFKHFESSVIDRSIFNCFDSSIKTVHITDSQSLLKIAVPGNFTIQQLIVEKTQLVWIRFQTNEAITAVWIVSSNLQQIPPSLKHLKNLNNIKLQHSHIQQLSLDLLKWCSALRSLVLTYNNIRTITSTLHSAQRRDLYMLNLGNNELRIINLEVLSPLGWFKYLDFSYNKIELLVGQFSSERLLSLILSHNRLKTLDFCQWKPIPTLTSILFEWNELLRVPNCIHQLPCLSYICLSNNELSTVNMDAFGEMGNLTDLDLSANKISLITFREEKHPKRLRRLILSNNKLQCSIPPGLPFCPLDIEFQSNQSHSSWKRNSVNFLNKLIVLT